MANTIISFENGLATVQEGKQVDQSALRNTTVYGKIMLTKGTKITDVSSRDQFLSSTSGEYLRAECFIVGNKGQIINVDKLWLNINKDADIMFNEHMKAFVVELVHPTFDASSNKPVSF